LGDENGVEPPYSIFRSVFALYAMLGENGAAGKQSHEIEVTMVLVQDGAE